MVATTGAGAGSSSSSSPHAAKRELRPMLPSALPSRSSSSSSSGISLVSLFALVAVIVVQLYAIAQWNAARAAMAAQSATGGPACATTSTSTITSPEQTLAVIKQAATSGADLTKPDGNAAAATTPRLTDSSSALSALQLLNKYLRMRRRQLDGASGQFGEAPLVTSDMAERPLSVLDEVVVGSGLRLNLVDEHDAKAKEEHDEAYLTRNPDLYKSVWLGLSESWAEHILHADRQLSDDERTRMKTCIGWYEEHKIEVDHHFRSLPKELHGKFNHYQCADIISEYVVAKYIQEHRDDYNRVLPVPTDRQRVQPEPGMEDKVIAIIVAITTRSLTINRVEDLALFQNLFPSFERTVEPGFEYWFYLGYDRGDAWFDNAEHLVQTATWFEQRVAAPLQARGIVAKLVFSTWTNPYKKPGPAFNHVTGVAYADGATWLYRINDDQIFETPWARAFVDALTEMGYPYGVVGPVCGQGATHILVVDFVHRTHHEIFPTHYPPSLQAWWMDNWVSQVYGRQRTKRVESAVITHLTGSHGTRYDGFWQVGQYMRGEILRGRAVLDEFLTHTPGMKDVLAKYRSDLFEYHARR